MDKRVVITGIGAITPLGKNAKDTWDGIKKGKCGIDKITKFDTENFKVKLAAEIKDFNVEEYIDPKTAKRMDKSSQYAVIAAKEAFKDSGISKENTDFDKIGTVVGTGMGGLETIEANCEKMALKGAGKISPMYIPKSILNMPAGNITIELGTKGESFCPVTACATSTHALGEAYRMVKHGYEDVVIAGGVEATITPSGIAGFQNIKALTTSEDNLRASIPFDNERSGFVMGEGAAILILEELEHAKKRGAKIYAEFVGYGATSDAYHITAPAPDGEGGAKAMVRAMEDANIRPEEITYINAHGTSTKLNDSLETLAVKKAFGEASKNVYMSSTKGNIGHLLGAAGAIEAMFCVKAIQDEFVPPTINYKVKDEKCDLNVVPNNGIEAEIKYAMSNSLGFGGHNSSIILKKYEK